MSHLLDVAEKLIRLKDKKKALDDKYSADYKKLEEELNTIQAMCPHPLVSHQSDPSGNGDDSDTCDLCEKEL